MFMEGTGWDCPRCGSEIKKFDQYCGYKLSCRECGYRVQGFFAKYYLKIEKFISERVSA